MADGEAVRLVQGKAGSEMAYGGPLESALRWQEDGADWVHLVDLDAAFGRGSKREVITEVVDRLDIPVEVSGGVRDDDSLAAALGTGCARVNIASAALAQPDWVRSAIARHGERVESAQDRWRPLNAPHLVALVRAGARFERGLLVEGDALVAV